MENPGMFISQEQIFSRIWGYNSETNSQVVWVNISYLRKKIADLQAPFVIKALRGTGYRLEEQEYGT